MGEGRREEEKEGARTEAVVEMAVITEGVCEGPWVLSADLLRDWTGIAASATAAAGAVAADKNNDGGGDSDSHGSSLGDWYRSIRRQRRSRL
jgi:hypothetical protein